MEYPQATLRNENELKEKLDPLVREWFFSKFKGFSLPQLYGVMPIYERKNILISAPTGGTKTLTCFLSIINYLVSLARKNEIEEKIYCVYVSPLKALNNDVYVNLVKPLEEIGEIARKKKVNLQKIRVAVRTGDTPTEERSKMLREAPHILVTTPETFAIVLTTRKFIELLKGVEYVIVDEIHALANKRGVYLSLSLERLEEVSKITPVRIGLSATVAPLEEIANFLVGNERDCLIADVQFSKKTDIRVLTPVKDLIDTTGEELHSSLYNLIDKMIQEHKTTIIFTNTRAATERVVHHLKERFPSRYLEDIGAHHSSLSKDHRFNIEQRLRDGKLKVVVTSTSLELGIDIGYVDLVILLGSPKSVARSLQRCLSYDAEVLCGDGEYRKIGEIVEKKLPIGIISYEKERGFITNKIKIWHKNKGEELLTLKLKCGEEIKCTKEHPILTNKGWKRANELKKRDLVAEVKNQIEFENKEPYLFELLPHNKIFVANKDNFFQKMIDDYRREKKINAKNFAGEFGMLYSRFIDCRRLKGRKKSVRLDYFLKACRLCEISKEKYLPCLVNLKTKGMKWPRWPLKLSEEIMWLAGIVATDGCIVKSKKSNEAEYYKVKIGNKSQMMIDKIREIVKKFDIKPYESLKEGVCHIEFGSNLLAYLFMSLGIPCKNKSFNIEINNNIFSLPKNLIYAYLEGIFEGDGNLNIRKNENHGMLRFFTASERFARGLHLLFSRLGYDNKVYRNKIKTSKLIKKVSGGDLYCIIICRKEELKKFFENIPCYGEKAQKGKRLTKDFKPFLSLKKDYSRFLGYSMVEEINTIKTESVVYNLTLEKEPNNFVVGNVVLHNCGRAGHKLHDVAKGRFIAMDRDDLVECSVLVKEAIERKIDKIQIPRNCLDVLSQQIYGMAIYKIWGTDEMLSLIKKSYCYSELSREDFFSVVSYLAGEYELEARNVYAKIWYDKESKQIGKRGKLARVIYMTNIGTIPEESFVNVIISAGERRNEKVGVIAEAFLERMKPGDVFVLGGNKYQYLYSRGMSAYVSASVYKLPTIPSWFSEMLPLSFDSALSIGRFRKFIDEKMKNSPEEIKEFIKEHVYCNEEVASEIYNYFYEQYKFAKIPNEKRFLIEFYKGEKNYVIFHCLYGRRVNDALSRAIAFLAARVGGRDIEIGINDNGFFLAGEKLQIEKALKSLDSKNLREVLEEAVEKTEILNRRFRHCATRSLMILRSYKGRKKTVGRQQMSSYFLLDSVKKISRNFPILKEARREVLEDLMDIENAKKVLDWIKEGKIKIEKINTKLPSPFALNLILQGYADLLKIEDKIAFLKRMHEEHMKEI